MEDYFLPHSSALKNKPIRFYKKIHPDIKCTIGKYKGFRHTCIEDGEETQLTFCNNCHNVFTYAHKDIKGIHTCTECGLIDCDPALVNTIYGEQLNETSN